MNNKRLLALFGLKWNPFLPSIPIQSLWPDPGIDTFLFQIENLVMDGGIALMSGKPGVGKSKNLQYLAYNLERLENVVVLAGVKNSLFEEEALTAVHQGAGGLFRKANHLARGAIIAAAESEKAMVTAEHVRLAATEL